MRIESKQRVRNRTHCWYVGRLLFSPTNFCTSKSQYVRSISVLVQLVWRMNPQGLWIWMTSEIMNTRISSFQNYGFRVSLTVDWKFQVLQQKSISVTSLYSRLHGFWLHVREETLFCLWDHSGHRRVSIWRKQDLVTCAGEWLKN